MSNQSSSHPVNEVPEVIETPEKPPPGLTYRQRARARKKQEAFDAYLVRDRLCKLVNTMYQQSYTYDSQSTGSLKRGIQNMSGNTFPGHNIGSSTSHEDSQAKRTRSLEPSTQEGRMRPTIPFESPSLPQSPPSGHLSYVEQIELLEGLPCPIVFRNFDDNNDDDLIVLLESSDVTTLRERLERLSNGEGILERGCGLSKADFCIGGGVGNPNDARLQREICYDFERNSTGFTPRMESVQKFVDKALDLDRGAGASASDWSTWVHEGVLNWALVESYNCRYLTLHSVKTSQIEPRSLCAVLDSGIANAKMDFVFAMVFHDEGGLASKPKRLRFLNRPENWNHITKHRTPFEDYLCERPILLNIRTLSSHTSWTDAKPEIGLWVDAWIRRVEALSVTYSFPMKKGWPPIPVLVAQGHDWHLLIGQPVVDSEGKYERIVFWHDIVVGTTRHAYGVYKLFAVIHELLGWTLKVWQPWMTGLYPNIRRRR